MKVLQFLGSLFIREFKTYRISNIRDLNKGVKIRNLCFGLTNIQRRVHSDHEEFGIDDGEFDLNEHFGKDKHFRNLLFSDSSDEIIIKLNNSASVKNVMDIINEYENFFTPEHITQAILVLKDLQIVYYSYNGYNKKLLGEFNESLKNSEDFQKLLQLIKSKLDGFDVRLLSDIYLLMNEFGILAQEDLMQDVALQLSKNLQKEFKLDICAKLFKVLFRERSIRPYFISLEFLPKLISLIDTCTSVHQFRELTECLIKIQRLLTEEVFDKYKTRVEYFLKTQLKGTDYQAILDIAVLLSHPNWRHQNTQLISKCLLLIKNEIDMLNMNELVCLYETFYKIQEPGELLNNIQRLCAKFLRLHEEKECCDIETNLKLFSAFIYFTSSSQRTKFRKDIEKYVDKCHTLETLTLLKRLLSYVKISNRDICERYWNMSLQFFETNKLSDVVRLCQNYISFNTDIPNYRHFKFEKKAFECIESAFDNEEIIYSSGIAVFLSFCLRYDAKDKLLSRLIDKLENNIYHMQPIHYIVMAEAMDKVKNTAIVPKHLSKMRTLMNAIQTKFAQEENTTFSQNILLLKALVIQNRTESYLFESWLYRFKEMECMSSKFIENVCNILSTSNSLVPEILNKCTEYVVNNSGNVIAFNVEKLLNLCYALAYYPVNDEKFFKTATDIILRDQERISGLSVLQSALSLSYFNKLPVTLIKHIFTIEFMDNLDTELANCYSKDRYPQRVRSTLMQLNRVICLEYPEYNIPWFHQKYVEELQKRGLQEPKNTSLRIAEYLSQVFDKNTIFENVITPYGYHIDFAFSFDNDEKLVPLYSEQSNKRLALLLMKPHSYTRFYKHLRGRYQLKNRHLEILGYDVRLINQNEWSNLLYARERLDFLKDLVGKDRDVLKDKDEKR